MTVDGSPETGRRDHPERDDRWYLADEREFLLRSLDDADRERAAGDLSDEDHAVLVARDSARLAEVEAELAALVPEPAGTRTGRRPRSGPERRPLPLWRRMGIVAACLLIAAGVVILVAHFVQARQPGQASSGSVSLSQAQLIEQQLEQALVQNNQGNTKAALELYDKVLTEDPSNPAALAYAGYLQWNVGSSAHVASLVRIGRAEIETAVRDSPSLLPGAPLLRPRPGEPGPRRRGRGGPVQRLPGRRPADGGAGAGRGTSWPAPTGRRGAAAVRVRPAGPATGTSAP